MQEQLTRNIREPMQVSASVKFDFKFNTFGDPDLIAMLEAATAFCADMLTGTMPRWVSFVGTSGAGKTFLAKAIWRFFQEQGMWYVGHGGANLVRDGRFCSWPKVVKKMKEGDYGPVADLEHLWFRVIDDVGAENDPSGNGVENLLQVLNGSLGKWGIITSNLSLDGIDKKLDHRIASRLIRDGNQVIDVEVMDYSLRNL